MIELAYQVVDVFAEQPFGGNGLCVVDVDGADIDASTMQAIARAVNLSETTFVRRTSDDSYDVRIFTPAAELPFAGHPSLGSAWTLGAGPWTQRSPGTTVNIDVTPEGATMSQPDPEITEVYPEDAAAAMAIPPSSAPRAFVVDLGGLRHLLVPTDHPLDRVRFDARGAFDATKAVRATGLGALRRLDDTTLQVRLVAPAETTTFEDPGTGSAAGPAGLLARTLWDVATDLVVKQGDEIGRPCRIHVHAEPGNVRVGGAVTRFANGVLTIAAAHHPRRPGL